ncbi:MAG: flagellin [Candidatus Brevundimonas colombiensis]|jgi:flagellar hook-associated protein 3 FlgL|uniref:Flagellin n=1 Tax=Candidatus Brevundimonas colombiensis TaxID=3121376 RepID=A0AAJ6BJD7_9CAUL|nr:flagellin [Brevundimonas sp.]WEK39725.1 MAG: flagellin [Brevundimonas sp.]
MNRVSTNGSFQSALLSLMTAQSRAQQAQERIDSEKIATDMAGYGRGAEQLTSLTSTQARLEGFINTGKTVAARLSAQDLALTRIYEGGTAAREAIATGLAAGNITNLMTELGLQYQTVQGGLNAEHQGSYLFAGGQGNVAPATAATMADLAAAPSTASTFANDTLKQKSRIDEKTTVETGFLASEIGGPLTQVFRNIQAFQNGTPVTVNGVTYTPTAAGTLTGQPSTDVAAFLKAQLAELDKANVGLTDQTAKNGLMQNHVDAALDSQQSQKTVLKKMMQDKSGYDSAQAITDLRQAQVAIEASAQVINTLKNTSLLNLLR